MIVIVRQLLYIYIMAEPSFSYHIPLFFFSLFLSLSLSLPLCVCVCSSLSFFLSLSLSVLLSLCASLSVRSLYPFLLLSFSVLQIADQLLERADTLHSRHLIHRDIKPVSYVIRLHLLLSWKDKGGFPFGTSIFLTLRHPPGVWHTCPTHTILIMSATVLSPSYLIHLRRTL